MLLRILAEYGEVEIGASEPFDKLLHKVGEKCTSVPGHKATISRLNKARVAFKHHGLPISNETALTFMDSVEAFLTEVSRDEMKLDFGSVSLVPMIGHQRTENWLHKAEKFAGDGSYRESLECAARAFTIYKKAVGRLQPRNYGMRPPHFPSEDHQLHRSLTDFARWVTENLEQVHTNVSFITKGVNPLSYGRFTALTPNVLYSMAKTLHVGWGPGSSFTPSKEEAEFCINFVVEAALQIRGSHLPAPSPDLHAENVTQSAVVKQDCDVIVCPDENPPEVIRKASVGEKLRVVSNVRTAEKPEYVTILQDGESAYVHRDCVRVGEEISDG